MAIQSPYLPRLESLRECLQDINTTENSVAERLRLLDILFKVDNAIGEFQSECEMVSTGFFINIDRDIDYNRWTNPNGWFSSFWMVHASNSLVEEKLRVCWDCSEQGVYDKPSLVGFAQQLPDDIPNSNYDHNTAVAVFSDMLNMLTGKYANVVFIQYVIYKSVLRLCDILSTLQKRLHESKDVSQYTAWGKLLYEQYRLFKGLDVKEDYDNRKQLHMGNVDKEWYEDQVIKLLEELYNTPFMQEMMKDITHRQANCAEVIFELDGLNASQNKKFYCALSRLCTYECGYFYFDEQAAFIGEFIYKHQKELTPDQQSAFFEFRRRVELIKEDIIALGQTVNDIFPDSFNFDNSNIQARYDRRRVYSVLYDLVGSDKLINAKWHWYIVYLVFQSKHWLISETATKFAEDICNIYRSVTSSNELFQPNEENFRKVNTYYKRHELTQWNNNDTDAPESCEEAIQIARTILSTFGRDFLLPST